MSPLKNEQHPGLSVPIEHVARLIKTFNRQQKAQLLKLVPELQTVRHEEADIPAEQVELMHYFQGKIEALPEQNPLQDHDLFLGELTVAEFFALPESEQARLWQEAHRAAEQELGNYEQPVRPDALPAR
jgi:hypothetical protein